MGQSGGAERAVDAGGVTGDGTVIAAVSVVVTTDGRDGKRIAAD